MNSIRLLSLFVLHQAESEGLSRRALAMSAGVKASLFESGDETQLTAAAPTLLNALVGLTVRPNLGLRVGSTFHPCLFGVGGSAATHAPSLRNALDLLARYVRLPLPWIETSYSTTRKTTRLQLTVDAPLSEQARAEIADG